MYVMMSSSGYDTFIIMLGRYATGIGAIRFCRNACKMNLHDMGEVIWYFEPQQAKQSPKLQFNVVDALFPVKMLSQFMRLVNYCMLIVSVWEDVGCHNNPVW